jgi:anti-sigma factor RsiW
MDCQKLDEVLFDFAESPEKRTLPPERRAEVDAHAAACARCRQEVAHYQATVQVLATAKMPQMPDSFWARQRERIMVAVRALASVRAWKAPPLSLVALMGILLGYSMLTLVPVYAILIGLALYVFKERGEGRVTRRS